METRRLILRKFNADDANAIYSQWASDEEVIRYLSWHAHPNLETTKAVLSNWLVAYEKGEQDRFGIVLKETGALIGAIDVVGFRDGQPEIGYVLSRKYWNQGLMTEACQMMVDHLFQKGYQAIYIEANVQNIGSNRVIQKVGFQFMRQEQKPCSSCKPEIITVNWYSYKNPYSM